MDQIAEEKKRRIPRCLQSIPITIAYWNKNKVFVDIISRLLSHMKIPFKSADPVLQLVVRCIFILLVNGYMATKYSCLHSDMFDDDTKSYTDIKKYISQRKNTLREYLVVFASNF